MSAVAPTAPAVSRLLGSAGFQRAQRAHKGRNVPLGEGFVVATGNRPGTVSVTHSVRPAPGSTEWPACRERMIRMLAEYALALRAAGWCVDERDLDRRREIVVTKALETTLAASGKGEK